MRERVLVVHNDYQQAGGERTAVRAQLALLQAEGHPLLLLGADNRDIEGYGLREKVLFFPRTLFSTDTAARVRRLVREHRPDVAHVHNVFPLLSPAVYRALHAEGVPIVQTVHNFRLLCPNSLFYTQGQICERCKGGNTLNAVRYRCYRNSRVTSALYALTIGGHRQAGTFGLIDRFLALTPFAADKLVESGLAPRARVTVLGNFLPEPLPAPGSFAEREPSLLFVGRISEEKGLAQGIHALAAAPGTTLRVLGDGPDRAALETLAGEVAPGQVQFLGWVEGAAKWDELRRATALVLPSVWYEHFPMTLLESFAAGTPVVASNLGSLAGLVEEGVTGLLCNPHDTEAFAARLRWLHAHPSAALRMGEAARTVVATRHTASQHYAALRGIYQAVRQP